MSTGPTHYHLSSWAYEQLTRKIFKHLQQILCMANLFTSPVNFWLQFPNKLNLQHSFNSFATTSTGYVPLQPLATLIQERLFTKSFLHVLMCSFDKTEYAVLYNLLTVALIK